MRTRCVMSKCQEAEDGRSPRTISHRGRLLQFLAGYFHIDKHSKHRPGQLPQLPWRHSCKWVGEPDQHRPGQVRAMSSSVNHDASPSLSLNQQHHPNPFISRPLICQQIVLVESPLVTGPGRNGKPICLTCYRFLSDPGVPGPIFVSVCPSVRHKLTFVKLNWCDSGWWGYQLNTNW